MDWKDAKKELLKDRKLAFWYYVPHPIYWLQREWLDFKIRRALKK